jgi:asparagine synthase (glutamine-hydrolysing)
MDAADVHALAGHPAPSPPARATRAASFDEVRYCEFRHFLASRLLRDADAFTMCRALELRTPFVDHVLVDSVLAAGRWRRARGLTHKATLFRHLSGLALPSGTDRPKQGFVLPLDAWMREALTGDRPRRLGDLKARLSHPRYGPLVSRFLERRLHWTGLWAVYVLDRVGGMPPGGQVSARSVA